MHQEARRSLEEVFHFVVVAFLSCPVASSPMADLQGQTATCSLTV